MGANKNSDLQKCGEILIDIKRIKHKTKSYTYRCAFCSIDCEQLKKFSKHLEDKHFRNFDQELKDVPVQMEPEISNPSSDREDFKMEQRIYIVDTNHNAVAPNNSIETNVYSDPLNMLKIENKDLLTINKKENETSYLEANMNASCEDLESDNDYTMNCNDFSSETEDDNSTNCRNKKIKDEQSSKKLIKIPKQYTSDVDSDNSKDSDFNVEKELNSHKKTKKSKKDNKKEAKTPKEASEKESVDDDEYPLSRRIYKKNLPLFIEQYKKHEILWNVNNIAFGVKPKILLILGKIADEIKVHLKRNINVHGVHTNLKYLNRLFSKDKKQELICKMENKEFIPESDLYTKLSFLSESQGPFLCSICNEIVTKYDIYCQHMAEHNGTPAFKCTSCEMTFAKFDKYRIHKKRHLKVYNCYCNVCGKGYLYQAELDYHLTSHTGLKPFLCSVCGEGFRSRNHHAVHMLRHENRFRYECNIYKKGFMYLHALNSHVKCHLNIRDIKCKICNMGFTGNKYLKRHEQKCHSNKP
ncbi:zinc finger protein 846-like [Lucilia sericata]|uniref:zinc finger protein 846-like n=1 Tax=Lucilia sericata TaxID=13632 RepID=UPI0018A85C33|nr:zinc finger protein 846-like [Lucilia sericata]